MYPKSKTKQYLHLVFEHSSVINYVMLTFSVKALWMAIYSIVGPNICQVSVYTVTLRIIQCKCLLLVQPNTP